jgi:methylmalonyl-CoA carboxyltransferase small subunit
MAVGDRFTAQSAIELEPSVKMQIAVGGQAYEVEIEIDGGGALLVGSSGGPHVGAQLQSKVLPTVPRAHPHSANEPDESKLCHSPVAGIVVRVSVKAGDELSPDDLILVLEAMKMETSVTAPFAGKLKSVKVVPGEAVKINQTLVEFE